METQLQQRLKTEIFILMNCFLWLVWGLGSHPNSVGQARRLEPKGAVNVEPEPGGRISFSSGGVQPFALKAHPHFKG